MTRCVPRRLTPALGAWPGLPLAMFAALALGCSGGNPWRGFPEATVTVRNSTVEELGPCAMRDGHLVVEIEEVLVREYPSFTRDPLAKGVRPLLTATLAAPGAEPGAAESAVLVAPPGYEAGQTIEFFRGRRVLDRPLRSLEHYELTLRVLKNDSTAKPEWLEMIDRAKVVGSAGSLLGLNNPGATISDTAWFLTQLDPDDLLLLFQLELDPLVARLQPLSARRTVRVLGVTPRGVEEDPKQPPTAELRVLAYLEPEPGCAEVLAPASLPPAATAVAPVAPADDGPSSSPAVEGAP